MTNEQVEVWNQSVGDAWVRHVEHFDATLGPFGQAVIDVLGPVDGDRILDVGCGVGTTTLDLADQVPTGEVTGMDISTHMLDEARRRASARRLANVRFLESDAQTAELGTDSYDVVFSRFGVMFFPDPSAAFSNVASSMAPSGRMGFVCFAAPGANPFILVPVMAAAAHLDLPAPAPDGPGPFSLADPERTAEMLRGAGFGDVVIEPGPDEAVLYGADDLDALAERLLEQNPVTGVRLAAVDPATRSAAIHATAEALRDHREGDQVRLGAGTWIVTAHSPSR